MGKGTVLSVLVNLQIPDDGSQKDDWRFHKEVPLLLSPRTVEIKHNGISTLMGIGDIGYKCRDYLNVPMTLTWVIQVNYKGLRLRFIGIKMIT